jgi:Protein of unknown function (DUF2798)
MKISKKRFGMLMGITVGLVMSFFMSLLVLLVSAGPIPDFFSIWMRSFANAFAISIPIGLIVFPFTEKLMLSVFHVQD